jgi:hypothetical protein
VSIGYANWISQGRMPVNEVNRIDLLFSVALVVFFVFASGVQ